MNSIKSARIRLTLWYLLIVTIVAISFSAVIYKGVTLDIEQTFRAAEYRLRGDLLVPRRPGQDLVILSEEFEHAKSAVMARLAIINIAIIAASGIAAYLLSGKTLQPVENAMVEQKRFISDASHELRTPLTALRTEVEVTLRSKNLNVKDAKLQLNSNLEEIIKMQNLTNYLLSLNRYETGEIKLKKKKVDLETVVEKVAKKHIAQAKKKGVILSTKLSPAVILANETGIEELVSILVDNALKYTDKSGSVNIEITHKGKATILRVKDTGTGMKASDIPYIFNRFYRADNARSNTGINGYGLGLAIAKSIANLHKAKIDVSSTLNKGSTFTVTFNS